MDESVVQEVFREYLKFHSYFTTLECFEAQVRSQSRGLTGHKALTVPRIYALVSGKTDNSQATSVLHAQKEAALFTARGVFAIAVECITQLEEANHKQVESYKAQLAKLQENIGLNVYMTQERDVLATGHRKHLAEQLRTALQQRDNATLTECLVSVRCDCLTVESGARDRAISGLVTDDILDSNVSTLLQNRAFSVKCALFGVLSVLCCTDKGKQYVLAADGIAVASQLMGELKEQEQGSVPQRFLLSILGKLTATEDALCEFLVKSKLVDWVINELLHKQIVQKQGSHPFCHLFGAALLINLLNVPAAKEYLSSMPDSARNYMSSILNLLQVNSLGAHAVYHLLIALSSILAYSKLGEQLEYLQMDRKMKTTASNVQNSCSDDMLRDLILTLCADLAQNTPVLLERPDNPPTIITFECFTDEIKLSSL